MSNELKKGFYKMPDPENDVYSKCKRIVDENGVPFLYNGRTFLYDASGKASEVQNAARVLNMMLSNEQIVISPFVDMEGNQAIRNCDTGELVKLDVKSPMSERLSAGNFVSEITDVKEPKAFSETRNQLISNAQNQPARVYVPAPIDNEKYGVESKVTVKSVVDDIVNNYVIRSYKQDLFIFAHVPNKYIRFSGDEVQQFIDGHLKMKKQHMNPSELDAVKKSLLYDSRIVKREKTELPAEVWAFLDGLYNICSGERIENYGDYFITETLNAYYNPTVVCPTFDAFVESCSGGNPLIVELIWQVIGYILSNDTKAKKFFLFTGPKDTGKSLMAHVISAALEEDVISAMGVNEFGIRFTNAELVDKHLVLCMDIAEEQLTPATVGTIKAITGGDKIRAEAKYKTAISTKIPAKILFGSNHQLQLRTPDAAFSDRMVIIPFLLPIPKEAQDRQLFEKLQTEISGIVSKAAKAYLRLRENNYIFPDVNALIPESKAVSHEMIVADFIKDCCYFRADNKIFTDDLYTAYKKYTMSKALPALEKSKFSEIVNQTCPGIVKKKMTMNGRNANGYEGLGLK